MSGKRILSFIGLVVTFAVAYGFDRLLSYMQTRLGVTVSAALGKSIFWVDSIAGVVLAAIVMLLGWYVVLRVRRDMWVGAVFAIVGFVLTFTMAIELSVGRSMWLSDRLWNLATLQTYGHWVAAFVLVIGIVCLVGPKRLRR